VLFIGTHGGFRFYGLGLGFSVYPLDFTRKMKPRMGLHKHKDLRRRSPRSQSSRLLSVTMLLTCPPSSAQTTAKTRTHTHTHNTCTQKHTKHAFMQSLPTCFAFSRWPSDTCKSYDNFRHQGRSSTLYLASASQGAAHKGRGLGQVLDNVLGRRVRQVHGLVMKVLEKSGRQGERGW
jgi:hypothetical protein